MPRCRRRGARAAWRRKHSQGQKTSTLCRSLTASATSASTTSVSLGWSPPAEGSSRSRSRTSTSSSGGAACAAPEDDAPALSHDGQCAHQHMRDGTLVVCTVPRARQEGAAKGRAHLRRGGQPAAQRRRTRRPRVASQGQRMGPRQCPRRPQRRRWRRSAPAAAAAAAGAFRGRRRCPAAPSCGTRCRGRRRTR